MLGMVYGAHTLHKTTLPEVDGQVASLRHIRIGLDLVPPESWEVQNVPLLQGTVQGVSLPKQREPLSIRNISIVQCI